MPKLPKSNEPMFAPAPNWGLACPLLRAKLEVKAGLKFPLLSPMLRPVPTTGAMGIPLPEFGSNCPPTLKVGATGPSPTWTLAVTAGDNCWV